MPAFECPSTSTKHKRFQVQKAEDDLAILKRLGVLETDPAYQRLLQQQGAALATIGFKTPKVPDWLRDWATYSPSRIRLGHDPEYGWFIAAREKPGAPLIYKIVNDETAAAIIKDEVTPEMERELFTPDEYLGE